MNKVFILSLSVLILASCGPKTNEEANKLQSQVDSLTQALEVNEYTMSLLSQVGAYMDSIDSNRKWITLNLETGLAQDDYVARMKSINQYVKKAEYTIGELEKTRGAYAKQIKRLKKQIADMDVEIKSLQRTVAQTQADNKQLEETLQLTQTELAMSQLEQDVTEQELSQANTLAQELMEKIEMTRAESYYNQGEGLEELASSIQFAPKRKKQALEDALKNYEAALKLGYEPAKSKVAALKEKLK